MKDTKQRALRTRRQALHLIKKDGAAVGLREESLARRVRIGECAALVPEQLILEQRVGQRRTIDGNERKSRLGTEVMKRTRHQFLACSGFPGDQNRGFGFGKAAELLADSNERWRFADELVQHLRAAPAKDSIVCSCRHAFFPHIALRANADVLPVFDDRPEGSAHSLPN